MLSLESVLHSVWDFIHKFLITFFHSLFKPQRFLENMLRRPAMYLNTKAYLFITLFVGYVAYTAWLRDDWFLPTINDLKNVIANANKLSVVQILFITAPLALLALLLFSFLVKLLKPGRGWTDFSINTTIIWFASTRFFIVLYLLLMVGIVVLFGKKNDEVSQVPDWLANILSIPLQESFILIIVILLMGLSVWALYRRFWKTNGKLFAKLLLCFALSFGTIFLIHSPYKWLESMGEMFRLSPPAEPEFVALYNYAPAEEHIQIRYAKGADTNYRLTASIMVLNKQKELLYFTKEAHFTLYPKYDMLPMDSTGGLDDFQIAFHIDKWYEGESKPILLVKPDDVQLLELSAACSENELMRLRQVLNKAGDSVQIEMPVSYFFKTKDKIDENMPNAKLYNHKSILFTKQVSLIENR